MEEVSFPLFTPRKTFQITHDLVVWSLFIISFAVFYFSDRYLGEGLMKDIGKIGLYISLFLFAFFTIFRAFLYKIIHGKIGGALIFRKNEIVVGDETYSMSQIKKIELHFDDYHGKLETGKSLNPARSVGIENTVFLTFIDGERRPIHFQIYHKGEFDKMHALIKAYYLQNKIHFLKLIEYLGISDYDEIQEFKKSLPAVQF
ncbi:MAG: hypothetical protein PHQ74_05955 [Crocinitomicaceae bacterium]|nr:hypothetical protein [Crocinitomicaceae bacterium]